MWHKLLDRFFHTFTESLLSPNDNSFHSVFKHQYYNSIIGKSKITPQQKIQLILEAYDKVSDTTVINYFKHCGLLKYSNRGGVADILKQGVLEWSRMSKKWQIKHHQSVEAYLEFRKKRTAILHGDLDPRSPFYLHNTTLEDVTWYISWVNKNKRKAEISKFWFFEKNRSDSLQLTDNNIDNIYLGTVKLIQSGTLIEND